MRCHEQNLSGRGAARLFHTRFSCCLLFLLEISGAMYEYNGVTVPTVGCES